MTKLQIDGVDTLIISIIVLYAGNVLTRRISYSSAPASTIGFRNFL